LSDKNGCMFTYGASGSGKTYTIMGGGGESAGLLPRAMESIFTSLDNRLYRETDIRPTGSAYIARVGISKEREQNKIKEEIMDRQVEPLSGDWNNKTVNRRSSLLNRPDNLEELPTADILSDLVQDSDYIAFGSFIEIYNEKIYDLLVAPAKGGKRDDLRIRQDAKGPYVGGVREIQINSAQEAYKLLDVGRKNLIVAQTKLNHESSRSHSKQIWRSESSRWWSASLCSSN